LRNSDPSLKTNAFRSKVMASKVDQLPTDLQGCKIEEVSNRLDLGRCEGSMKPHHAALEHVRCFLPAAKVPRTVKNLAGKS